MKHRHASSIAFALLASSSALASTPNTPEQEVARIARTLKPIPDDEWKQIAGEHLTQKFTITKGDTLYDISKTLFGDGKYWPKLWAINGQGITNPHLIFPGNTIAFIPGTGSSLPSLSVETAENETGTGTTMTDVPLEDGHPPRSDEWKRFPIQEWENVQLQLPPEVDPLGFDTRSRVRSHGPIGFDLPVMALSRKAQALGRIFASEKEGEFISLDELVFIHPEGDLQIGQTYSITEEPEKLDNEVSPRSGYAYELEATVKILENREGMFIGMVGQVSHPFERGAILIPLQPKIPEMVPVPGPSRLEGVVMLNRQVSTGTTMQHAFVFIDRGSDDGVAPGMVFRSYERIDPNNEKQITKANILINSDIMVVHTSQKFCTGLVLSSFNYMTEGAPVVLLTDVSDLLKKHAPNQSRLETQGTTPTDALDSLDNGNGLMDSEKRELKQLEKWKQNPTAEPSPEPSPEASIPAPELSPVPSPTPSPESSEIPAPVPSEEIPPPPPGEGAVPPTAPIPGEEALPPPPATNLEVPPPPASEPAIEAVPPPPSTPPAIDQAAPPTNEIPPPVTDIPPPPPPDLSP
jgi:hypothetical protein